MYKNALLPVKKQKKLQKAKDVYSKEKVAEYYLKNKETIKEMLKKSIYKLVRK